jgi:hypothetical protein
MAVVYRCNLRLVPLYFLENSKLNFFSDIGISKGCAGVASSEGGG